MGKTKTVEEPTATEVAQVRPANAIDAETSPDPVARSLVTFPIVGVGASAGGLEAFTQLLAALPVDTGMAFVVIQHLNATQPSMLAEALTNATTMTVTQAENGQRVEPNHVYVIPPHADLAIMNGVLVLTARMSGSGIVHLPIDAFFRSLAEECGHHAIGVVLSGTASDGTEGLRAIKAADGITLVQDPDTAKFDGMPRSAIAAGVVDFCLDLPALADELARLSRHPYVAAVPAPAPDASDAETLKQIFAIVRRAAGADFSEYKVPTFERRLARRMALRHVDTRAAYLALLEQDQAEGSKLFEDTLIHVTSFFRDPEVFDALREHVLPALLERRKDEGPIRVWVAGCSTGEEVYSLGIEIVEFLASVQSHRAVQIFGSDISDKVIDTARAGLFHESALRDVSDERRRRHFTKLDNGFRINKSIRDLCVFVRHDLARDPPFSKLDLVSCRNVLIYFGQTLQKRVLPTFHYALNPGGFLLLGRTESVSGFAQLFTATNSTNKFFERTAGTSALRFAPRSESHAATSDGAIARKGPYPRRSEEVTRHLDRLLLARYAPPGALVNEKLEVLQFCGDTGPYLRAAPGEPQSNILKMARSGLAPTLSATVAQAKKAMVPVRSKGITVGDGASAKACEVVAMPFTGNEQLGEPLFVVLFEEVSDATTVPKKGEVIATVESAADIERVTKIEHELTATKAYLQSLLDDQDRINEDLNAANEELVSGNEELQSMNEELETAKEELQSTNEELTTVNDELQSRNQEVSEINSDLVNILASVDVPILILDMERRIRRFTPQARRILSVVASDIGRPLDDIKSNLDIDDLDARIANAIETNTMHESEIRDRSGSWFRMQIRPYKTIDNRIDGATLSPFDIDALKHHVDDAEVAKRAAERANRAKDEFLATLSHEIRTPLSSMLMQAQLLRRGSAEPAKVLHAAEVIERGTRLQVQLIDDLLDVSRIVTNKLRIEFKPVDMCALVRACYDLVSAPAERKSLEIHMALDEALPPVTGDVVRLTQVVTNLLANALKFTPKDGKIFLTLDAEGGYARLVVRDTGMGIDPEFLPHIFNRFAQEDATIVRRHGGLGLGLSIAHALVGLHDGSIRAESEGRGHGTTFTVLLPLCPTQVDEVVDTGLGASAPVGARHETTWLVGTHVLVVDDDLVTRDTLAALLVESGAKVSVAGSVAEAMERFASDRPDVLISDIAMPGEDGYELLGRIRSLRIEHGGGVPAVALTALAGTENRSRALAAGFSQHMSKPIEFDRLLLVLRELLGR